MYNEFSQDLDQLIIHFLKVDESIKAVEADPDLLTEDQKVHIKTKVKVFTDLLAEA